MADPRTIRMMFFPREKYPTDRVRLTTLFGRELLGRGHAIDLVMQARDPGIIPGRHDWHGRSVWVGPTSDGNSFLQRAQRTTRGFIHAVRQLMSATRDRYDSILVSDLYFFGMFACLFCRLRSQNFFFWLTYPYHQAHLTISEERLYGQGLLSSLRGRLGAFLLFRVIVPNSRHVFVQSERMLRDFEEAGVPASKLTPIVTGVDLAGVEAIKRPKREGNDSPLRIGYLGTLVRQRRIEMLVEMLDELRCRHVPATLLLIGDGARPEDRAAIESRAKELGLENNITITGFLSRPDALRLIQTADVCVSPFRLTPALAVASPTKLVEYLALGIPVVANSHPDQSQVLRECRAGVCAPWGARHFARAVHWLSQQSSDYIQEMGNRGKQWVDANRTYGSIADTFERAYFNALGTEQLVTMHRSDP